MNSVILVVLCVFVFDIRCFLFFLKFSLLFFFILFLLFVILFSFLFFWGGGGQGGGPTNPGPFFYVNVFELFFVEGMVCPETKPGPLFFCFNLPPFFIFIFFVDFYYNVYIFLLWFFWKGGGAQGPNPGP